MRLPQELVEHYLTCGQQIYERGTVIISREWANS
jgi:hypothetical protein